MEKKNIILYTPGNVNVKENTKVSFSNNSADVCLNKRSQEFYDAMNEQYNVVAWCCGKYGQHEYSRELGEAWCIFVQQFLAKVEKNKLPIDFEIQINLSVPSFIFLNKLLYETNGTILKSKSPNSLKCIICLIGTIFFTLIPISITLELE